MARIVSVKTSLSSSSSSPSSRACHRWLQLSAILLALLPHHTIWAGQSACGIRQTRNDSVVAGEPIEPGEWPWQVAIYWWRDPKLRLSPPVRVCEGALLTSDGWVLTAARCVRDSSSGRVLPINGMVVHIGLVALQQKSEGSKRFEVNNIMLNDELDVALIRVKLDESDEWEGMPICLTEGAEDWDKLYGKPVYVLQQSHRHKLGGFEIVKLLLKEEVQCYGSKVALRAFSIWEQGIKLATTGTDYRHSARGTPLYVRKPGGIWTLLGISNKIRINIPGSFCQPGDYETFLNINQDEARQWIIDQINESLFDSLETATE